MSGLLYCLCLLLATLPALLGSPQLQAAEASAHPVLKAGLGVSDQLYGLQGKQPGFEQLLLEALLKELQLPYQLVKAPHARLSLMLQQQELDLAVRQFAPEQSGTAAGRTTDLQAGTEQTTAPLSSAGHHTTIFLTAPYITFHDKVFARADFRGTLQRSADLLPHSIVAFQNASAVMGLTYQQTVSQARQYTELNDHTQAVLMLLRGRADLLVQDEQTVQRVLQQLAQQQDFQPPAPLRVFDLFPPIHYRIGCRDQALANKISLLLKKWQQSGRLAQLRQQSRQPAGKQTPAPAEPRGNSSHAGSLLN